MGLYDIVEYKATCPLCRSDIEEFQTKETAVPSMARLQPQQLENGAVFYTTCKECNIWVEYEVEFDETVEGLKRIYEVLKKKLMTVRQVKV